MKLIITDIPEFSLGTGEPHEIIRPEGSITPCIGCFGCWVKTPGRCVIRDGYENTGIRMSRADELVIISECFYGGFSPFVKAVLDRAISYVHPDFVIRGGEMHHKRRYKNTLRLTAVLYGADITEAEKETAAELLESMSDNYGSAAADVCFCLTAGEAAQAAGGVL